jgi:hypothetical protein
MAGRIVTLRVNVTGAGTSVTLHAIGATGAYAALGSALTAVGDNTVAYSDGNKWVVLAETAT